MSELKYKRVLLKLSGEVLAGKQKTGVDVETVGKICDKVKEIVEMGVQVAIVVGGGNFWRGRNGHQMERTTADYMGMLATAMNGLALQDARRKCGSGLRVGKSCAGTVGNQHVCRANEGLPQQDSGASGEGRQGIFVVLPHRC